VSATIDDRNRGDADHQRDPEESQRIEHSELAGLARRYPGRHHLPSVVDQPLTGVLDGRLLERRRAGAVFVDVGERRLRPAGGRSHRHLDIRQRRADNQPANQSRLPKRGVT